MKKILKVFCSGEEQKQLAKNYPVVTKYDAFLLLEVSAQHAAQIARKYPVEDLTEQFKIRLGRRSISTSRSAISMKGRMRSQIASGGTKSLKPGPHHYLVQFAGPIKESWLSALRRIGAEPRAPFADFTFVVRATEDTIRQVSGLDFVRWVGHLPHRDRVDPSVFSQVGRTARDARGGLPRTRIIPGVHVVDFFGPKDLKAALSSVRKLGISILDKGSSGTALVIDLPEGAAKQRRAIDGLAAIHGVRSIHQRSLKRPSNDVAAGIMDTAASLSSSGLALSGKGEIIAVCDTGLDTGDPNNIHGDFSGRVAWIKSYPITADFTPFVNNPGANDGPADLDSGHGTHVAGSVLGDGTLSANLPALAGPIRGLAHKAQLVFQAVEQEIKWKNPADLRANGRYILAGIPLDLSSLFGDAYRQGARIHSNSWGGGAPGEYDTQCEQLDRFVWEHKDFCVVVAAGNDGTDKDGDGRINPMSVTSPGTAKNCITVGACENRRPNFDGQTYGGWWPQDYPAAPYVTAPMADNANQVVAFSSRGPTRDGRVKPEIVAPGTFILSTRSTMIASNNTAWAPFPPSRLYFHMGGTSMATPLTAGAVAIVRQYLRGRSSTSNPSAALLKASLIAGAARLPGTALPSAILDNDQGYGRVDIDAILAPRRPRVAKFADVIHGLRTGQANRRSIVVRSSSSDLRIVLAYSDYPGPNLVNNLNLIVTGPNGDRYLGNRPNANPPTPDTGNNVEVVNVRRPKAGAWTVDVVGSNVPRGPQDFALVCLGNFA